MYVKLALSNAKKSIKDYLIYFITITICVSLFYAITSLSSSSYEFITEKSYNFEALKLILKYSTYIITAALALLIAYVNKYMIKRRQKEFATYILLGAEQRSVALMFFIEMLFIGILAIITGILIGTLFSQVITALVLMSINQEITFSFKLYEDTVLITFVFFILMFCIIGIYNIAILRKTKLIDMINAHKQVEFQFKRSKKVYSAVFLSSIILYIICGYCTIKLINTKIDYSINQIIYIGISLFSFILATYALFYSLAYIIIYIKNKSINFKYEKTNLFLLGSILSKIKTSPILMSTISITFLGAMISFIITLVMAQWSLGYLDMRVPYDIDIENKYSENFVKDSSINDIKDIPKLDYSEVIDYLNADGYDVSNYCQVEEYFINKEDFYNRNPKDVPVVAIKLSDFNKLRSMLGYEKIKFKDDEFAVQYHMVVNDKDIKKNIEKISSLNTDGKTLKISETPYYKESIGEGIYNLWSDHIIILPDKICDNLTLAKTNLLANINKKMTYEEANDFQNNYVYNWFEQNNKELVEKYSKEYNISHDLIESRIKSSETNNILTATLAMRILGIYLGIVLLMISLTILSLSQLADSIEHKDRFNVLRKLGVEEKEVNSIVLKQISLYFIMPISIAIIGVIIFIYNYYLIYKDVISTYIGDRAFLFSIATGIILMIGIYICYFIGTYYTFKRNIKN
ncbi:FtsX-like permease family protein [Intestinibacter sp.]